MNRQELSEIIRANVAAAVNAKYGTDFTKDDFEIFWQSSAMNIHKWMLIDDGQNDRIYQATMDKITGSVEIKFYVPDTNE